MLWSYNIFNVDVNLMQMLEVRVPNLDCEGCASKLKKALLKLKGTLYPFILALVFFSFFFFWYKPNVSFRPTSWGPW